MKLFVAVLVCYLAIVNTSRIDVNSKSRVLTVPKPASSPETKSNTARDASGCASVQCNGNGTQYYPNPLSCDSFCQCSNGTPYEMPCALGTKYSAQALVCVHPNDTTCQVTTTTSSSVP